MKRQKQKYREKHSRKIESMIERKSRKEGQRERDMKRERERKREQKAEVDLSFISAKRIGRVSSFLECGDRKGPGGQQYVTIQNAAILYCRPCAHVLYVPCSRAADPWWALRLSEGYLLRVIMYTCTSLNPG
jgi:hypothetical protein